MFAVADEVTVQLKRDLGIPSHHIETASDLPVATILTASMPALEAFSRGIERIMEREWTAGAEQLKRAVEVDTTFGYGYMALYEIYLETNRAAESEWAEKAMMRHLYKMPERIQYIAKLKYYFHAGDPDKALGVIKMMVNLFPDDIEARAILAEIRQIRNERDLAIQEYERILEINPSRTEFLQRMANQYVELGEYDEAVHYYEAYLDKHPDDAGAYHVLGTTYELQGQYEEAKEYYNKSLVLEPGQVRVLADLGDVERKLCNDQAALDAFDRALDASKTPRDRRRVYRSTKAFYLKRGMIEKALEQLQLRWAEEEQFLPPLSARIAKLEDLCIFVRAGRKEEAFDKLEEIKAVMEPPYDQLLSIGYQCIYDELGEPDRAEDAVDQLEAYMEKYRIEQHRNDVYVARGRVEEDRGNHEAAAEWYEKTLELDPTWRSMHRDMGRCYRKLGRYDEAVTSLERMLEIYPCDAEANYEFALAHYHMGNREEALQHLQNALEIWKHADPGFEPAREARATLEEWSATRAGSSP